MSGNTYLINNIFTYLIKLLERHKKVFKQIASKCASSNKQTKMSKKSSFVG
jgi:hypothetical protein